MDAPHLSIPTLSLETAALPVTWTMSAPPTSSNATAASWPAKAIHRRYKLSPRAIGLLFRGRQAPPQISQIGVNTARLPQRGMQRIACGIHAIMHEHACCIVFWLILDRQVKNGNPAWHAGHA